MNKRDAIIFTAAQLIHEKGYHNIGIKSILDALSIPKGSFYHYFSSKEALALAIIDLYIEDTQSCIENSDTSVEGLKSFFNIFFNRLIDLELKRGCPVGNLVLELSDENETFRLKLHEWYDFLKVWIAKVLNDEGIDKAEVKAKALWAAFEGTMMLSKLDKNPEHFEIFNDLTFPSIVHHSL